MRRPPKKTIRIQQLRNIELDQLKALNKREDQRNSNPTDLLLQNQSENNVILFWPVLVTTELVLEKLYYQPREVRHHNSEIFY